LDFLVVADHAENLGLAPLMTAEDPMVMDNAWGKKITNYYKKGELAKAYAMWGTQVTKGEDPFAGDTKMAKSMWGRIIDAAEKHDPDLIKKILKELVPEYQPYNSI
jgi:hypothetical protein